MKRIMILVIMLVLILSQTAHAHPPSKIDAAFDASTEILEVYITHKVGNPNKHFIETVTINLDGQEIIKTKLFLQDDKEGLSLNYRIPDVTKGSVIILKAECKKGGSLTERIPVE